MTNNLQTPAVWAAALQQEMLPSSKVQKAVIHPTLSKQRQKWEKGKVKQKTQQSKSNVWDAKPDKILTKANNLSLAQKLGIVDSPKILSISEWAPIKEKARARKLCSCPICCEPFAHHPLVRAIVYQ
jgi:hypothetical protein